jgi:hypothetical protein
MNKFLNKHELYTFVEYHCFTFSGNVKQKPNFTKPKHTLFIGNLVMITEREQNT